MGGFFSGTVLANDSCCTFPPGVAALPELERDLQRPFALHATLAVEIRFQDL